MSTELPPLPEPSHGFYATPMYAPDQMRDYALSAIAPLEAQVKALEADAARYRWLRSIDSYGEWNRVGHYAADALDKTIDAARNEDRG